MLAAVTGCLCGRHTLQFWYPPALSPGQNSLCVLVEPAATQRRTLHASIAAAAAAPLRQHMFVVLRGFSWAQHGQLCYLCGKRCLKCCQRQSGDNWDTIDVSHHPAVLHLHVCALPRLVILQLFMMCTTPPHRCNKRGLESCNTHRPCSHSRPFKQP